MVKVMPINIAASITSRAWNLVETGNAIYDCERLTFHNDESQFNPKRHPQHAVLTILDAKSLVFCADEDGTYHVTGPDADSAAAPNVTLLSAIHEQQKKSIVEAGMP